MIVVPTTKSVCDEFISRKHYSHRPPIFTRGFALVEGDMIEGVVTFSPPSPQLSKHAFENRDFIFWELSRLVVQTPTKNAASFLIGNALKQLPSCALVSFADTLHDHCGIVYQATNWLYTGQTTSHDHLYLVNGETLHAMTLRDRGITNPKQWARENGIETIKPKPKHRYFTYVGNKREKRHMARRLKYPLHSYPKCDTVRYDDGAKIEIPWEA